MTTKYTTKQIQEFKEFYTRHGFQFGNRVEYDAAIDTYFGNDPFAQAFVPCEQQRAPMDAETLDIDIQMRKHYSKSYGTI